MKHGVFLAIGLGLAVFGCGGGGGSSGGAAEPAGGGDLSSMTWVAAIATYPREVCDRMAVVMGPHVERDCPEGGHESRGFNPAQCEAGTADMPNLPADCPTTVAEVEACFAAITALPECAGMAIMDVMFGPPCAAMNACHRREEASEPASTDGGDTASAGS